jgi:c-di-GMP-binding flagellar brake protein YcgR
MSQEHDLEDIITYAPQILGLLNRIRDAHILLSVTLENDKRQYSSALLETLTDDNILVLDELYPRTGHHKVIPGSTLHVQTRLNGVATQFDCHIESIEESSGVAAYHAQLPESIAYYQKRQQFRAQLDFEHEIFVRIEPRPGKVVMGQVFDISLNGLGLHFDTTAGLNLENGQQYAGIAIELPGCHPFLTTLEIRSMRLDKTESMLIVGAQFLDLPQRDQRQIQRYVAMLDRQARQNRRE